MKYYNRIYDEASEEFVKPYRKNLPLIEAIATMVIISRAIAESIEIFPYSVNKIIVSMANSWAYLIAPIVDKVYGSLGYIFSPDVALMHRLPVEKSNISFTCMDDRSLELLGNVYVCLLVSFNLGNLRNW